MLKLISIETTTGLRQTHRGTINETGFTILDNVIVRERGLYDYESVWCNLSDTGTDDRIFKHQNSHLLFQSDGICSVDLSADPWEVSALDLIDSGSLTATSISNCSGWQFISLPNGWIACAQTGSDSYITVFERAGTIYVDTNTNCTGVGELKGRVFWLGLTNFFSNMNTSYSNDSSYIEAVLGDGAVLSGLTDASVHWCSIGGEDIFWHIFPIEMHSPKFDTGSNPWPTAPIPLSSSPYIQLMKSEQVGDVTLGVNDVGLAVKSLRNSMIVYLKNSIYALVPLTNPVAGMSVQKIADFGIRSRVSVGGDLDKHIFISQNGSMYTLDSEHKLNKLGYQEFFNSELVKGISYDSELSDAYILCSAKTYMLTGQGLSTISGELVSSVFRSKDELVLLGLTNMTDSGSRIAQTDRYDFGISDEKVLRSLRLHGDSGCTKVVVQASDDDSTYIFHTYAVTNGGIADMKVRGKYFRFSFHFNTTSKLSAVDFTIELTAQTRKYMRSRIYGA